MIQTNEVASITVLIPFRLPGNIISQEIVPFKIYEEDTWYRAIAQISASDRIQADLPENILVSFNGQKIVVKDDADQNLIAVLRNIVQELKMQRLIG